eukprot:COSAG01_NODE_8093_length_2924_cov_4.376991_4_plen_64_part_00
METHLVRLSFTHYLVLSDAHTEDVVFADVSQVNLCGYSYGEFGLDDESAMLEACQRVRCDTPP